MSELNEILDIVNEENEVIGQATRGECYEKGLLHRGVNIFIFNSKGEVFLHKRSNKKLKYPLFWDLSASEHVKKGEDFDAAAKRGLKEELDVELALELIILIHKIESKYSRYFDNELVKTYKGVYDGQMKLDPNEVADGKFFKIEEVNKMIKEKKIKFTPWFLKEWKIINE